MSLRTGLVSPATALLLLLCSSLLQTLPVSAIKVGLPPADATEKAEAPQAVTEQSISHYLAVTDDDGKASAEMKERHVLETILPLLIKGALNKQNNETVERNLAAPLGNEQLVLSSSTKKDIATAACYGSSAPKKIIITLGVDMPPGYMELLRQNRLMLADRYSYKYCEYTHSLTPSRHIIWSKITATRTLLNEVSVPIVWMDADAWFTNPNRNFEQYTDEILATKDAVFTADLPWNPINLGIYVTESTPWTKQFWTDIWNDESHLTANFMEQGAVVDWRAKHMAEFNAHAAIIELPRMNSVAQDHGEFIAHMAGQPDKYEVATQKMKEIYEQFVR